VVSISSYFKILCYLLAQIYRIGVFGSLFDPGLVVWFTLLISVCSIAEFGIGCLPLSHLLSGLLVGPLTWWIGRMIDVLVQVQWLVERTGRHGLRILFRYLFKVLLYP
jgi:hypothetical protein